MKESPKDVVEDLSPEMRRLLVPFGTANNAYSGGSFRYLAELNSSLASVFGNSFSVKTFAIDNDSCSFSVSKFGETINGPDYLSAGENECFFTFVILHSLPCDSIAVLDALALTRNGPPVLG